MLLSRIVDRKIARRFFTISEPGQSEPADELCAGQHAFLSPGCPSPRAPVTAGEPGVQGGNTQKRGSLW